MNLKFASALLSVLLLGTATAKELAVLTIGNSFADSVFGYLPKIAESAGDKIILERANIGGCPLDKHWALVEQSEADPTVKPYYKKFTLKEKLQSRKWDVVTIQQASGKSWKPETYSPYAKNLYDYVKKYAPDAEVVIQQTWAYRFDDKRLAAWEIDQKEMYKRLTDAYNKAAAELGVRQIPSGDAVQLARETQAKPYVPYDPAVLKTLKHPDALPSEEGSFAKGLSWGKDKAGEYIVKSDPAHLNKRGEYLQACVWYGFLFGKPVSEVKFVPKEVDGQDAAFLRAAAQKALDAREKK
jgi:hypothetical protein